MTHHGQFHWNELMTWDAERAKDFYAAAIGWEFSPLIMGIGPTYWIAIMDDKPVAGIQTMYGPESAGLEDYWVSYLSVNDVDVSVKKAREYGAEILQEPFDVPNIGRIAMVRQPGGAVLGWITPN